MPLQVIGLCRHRKSRGKRVYSKSMAMNLSLATRAEAKLSFWGHAGAIPFSHVAFENGTLAQQVSVGTSTSITKSANIRFLVLARRWSKSRFLMYQLRRRHPARFPHTTFCSTYKKLYMLMSPLHACYIHTPLLNTGGSPTHFPYVALTSACGE